MTRTLPWQKPDPVKNYYPVPKVICQLGLSPGEIAVYSFLLFCEDRKTYQCYPSYRTIGEAVWMIFTNDSEWTTISHRCCYTAT